MSMPMSEVTTKIIQMQPNLINTKTETMGQKIVEGFDGTMAWMLNPLLWEKARPMPESLKSQFLENEQTLRPDWIYY